MTAILGHLATIYLNDHLDVIGTLPHVQSAFRHYHSTEAVLMKVVLMIILSDVSIAN